MSRSEAHEARNQVMRDALSTPEAARAGSVTPTKEVVADSTKSLNVSVKVEEVPESDGAQIHWIGDSRHENVLLYFHGGGFAMAPFPGHIMFLVQTQEKLAAKGKPFSIAFIEYGLTPKHVFPVQHKQAALALEQILKSGRKPSNVIVGGDSAGGNLAIGVLSATNPSHKHASIPSVSLSAPLKGALLISPWTSFSAESDSYKENVSKDIITVGIMEGLRDDFILSSPTGKADEFAEPDLADAKWWQGTPVGSVLNLAGGYEMFRDHIVRIGDRMKEGGVNVRTVECPKQVHIDCILDAGSHLVVGRMSEAIWEWLEEVL